MEREKITSLLTDIRGALLKSLWAVAIAAIISFIYAREIIKLFLGTAGNLQIYYLTLSEVFFAAVEIALYGGVFFAFPVITYLVWRALRGVLGIKPVHGYVFIFFASVLFYGGSFFCYSVVLPSGISFLLGYESNTIRAMISVERFVLFCTAMVFAFGMTFEIPIIMMAISKAGIVTSRSLAKTRRYAIFAVTVAAALVTPTPDVYNMALLAVPMYILYEAGIFLIKITEKKP